MPSDSHYRYGIVHTKEVEALSLHAYINILVAKTLDFIFEVIAVFLTYNLKLCNCMFVIYVKILQLFYSTILNGLNYCRYFSILLTYTYTSIEYISNM